MKTGVIIYVIVTKELGKDFDIEKAVSRLNINADRVEVVSSQTDYYDMMDAWRTLIVRGMKRIVCKTAEALNGSDIKLTGRELVLG